MSGILARVVGGRLVVDMPTELPEGTVLSLVVDDEGDDLDEASRAALHAAIRRGVAQADAGKTVPADEVLRKLDRR